MSSNSEPFTNMAEVINNNPPELFAGAAVIVPPGSGLPLDFIQLGKNPDEGQFWSTILTSIQIRLKQIEEQRQVGRTFGMR